jgi:hypothetical protein
VDVDDAAAIIASLLDGLAVQVTVRDPGFRQDRMRDLAVSAAELILECELPPVGAVPAIGSGAGPR